MNNQDENGLFLLEVLVDKIIFVQSPCFSDKGFTTCVNIESPSVVPLEICDSEPSEVFAKGSGLYTKYFNFGKSCLFSLNKSDIAKAMSKFPIEVRVYKSLPCDCIPSKIVMGHCTIDMTKEFVEARSNFLKDPTSVSYQALKDSFQLVDPDGVKTGEVIMFLRISCFGNNITTRFQGPGGPTNFGATKNNMIVNKSCNPIRDIQSKQASCVHCGAARGSSPDPYNSMPCQDSDDPCYCCGPKHTTKQQMACRNADKYCLHVPKGRSKQFEEIGTNLGGNELRIKVPASASIIKKISQTHCAMQCPYIKGVHHGPCEPPCGKNQITLALPSEAIGCQGPQHAGTEFTCTTEGCLQASKHGQQNTLARGDNKQNNLSGLNNQDVFVLKVAKTAFQGDRKCKLELELVTPKGPDKKKPIKKMNTCLQSDFDCKCFVQRLKKPKSKKKL